MIRWFVSLVLIAIIGILSYKQYKYEEADEQLENEYWSHHGEDYEHH